MKTINHIAKFKTFILVIGLIAGLGIVAQPILKNYVDCTERCEINKESDSNDDSSKKSDQSDEKTYVSALEAVAPTAQIHFSPLDFLLQNHTPTTKPALSLAEYLAVNLPEKFVKFLFNVLIAPNAP